MPVEVPNRLRSAVRELHDFVRRVDGLVQGQGDIGPEDLRKVARLLQSVALDVRDSLSGGSADADSIALIREYAGSLRATQRALEQVRCVMLARRARMDGERGRLNQLQGWTSAYRQTT